MSEHLLETAVVAAFLAGESGPNRRLHNIVDTPGASAAKEGDGPIMRFKNKLLALAHIDPGKHHAALAKPDMGNLHRDCHAIDQHDIMAAVELIRLTRPIIERHIGIAMADPRAFAQVLA